MPLSNPKHPRGRHVVSRVRYQMLCVGSQLRSIRRKSGRLAFRSLQKDGAVSGLLGGLGVGTWLVRWCLLSYLLRLLSNELLPPSAGSAIRRNLISRSHRRPSRRASYYKVSWIEAALLPASSKSIDDQVSQEYHPGRDRDPAAVILCASLQ